MSPRLAALVATIALALVGCAAFERTAATADACTAALEARDSLAKGEEEMPDLTDFQEDAQQAENPALSELANRAVLAGEREDRDELETVLDETRSLCQSEGAV